MGAEVRARTEVVAVSRADGVGADIARNLQAIERLKADLAAGVAALYQGMYRNEDAAIEDALADVVASAFLLSQRLGISYASLDGAVLRRLRAMAEQGHEAEAWFGDCSTLMKYLQDGAG
ncbi:MAG: MazG-like family protein [Limnochordales bacterium]|nr:MAG: hypothetical protein DIU82_09900 [Bacillota bacterium]HLT58107.1 MazG-like family protein [Limnochordales bacterium]